ncbi:MAG: hypothetical protein AABZ09_07040, partial [Candidatus Binatota bacterium]
DSKWPALRFYNLVFQQPVDILTILISPRQPAGPGDDLVHALVQVEGDLRLCNHLGQINNWPES